MNSKTLAFIAMMGALGNVLFLFSYHAGKIPWVEGVAIDLSLIGTLIVAINAGPIEGLFTGLLVGILPGVYFGPLGNGSWLGLIGLPIGKALTGFTTGLLTKGLNLKERPYKSLLIVPTVLLSYIPECLFTVAYFVYLLPYFIGGGGIGILLWVLPKAWIEVVLMGFLMGALAGNQGFNNFVNRFFATFASVKRE
jgi:riboflavin transporter FmnP